MTPVGEHRGRYNLPSTNNPEVAVVLDETSTHPRDIVIKQLDNRLSRISEFHPSYDALQYPILLPRGENGYHFGSPITCMKHYSYMLMVRQPDAGTPTQSRFRISSLHAAKGLFQQFLVDVAAKTISERLTWCRTHQDDIRAEAYSNLMDQATSGGSLDDVGRAVRLPSTFFGGPRYMYNRQQDAFAILRRYLYSQIFLIIINIISCSKIYDFVLN